MDEQKKLSQDLSELFNVPNITNREPLAHNLNESQRLKNFGYPKHMFHEQMSAEIAVNEAQENLLRSRGYSEYYKHKAYPAMRFKRNLATKFKADSFVEARTVKTEAEDDKLGEGWFDSIDKLPEGPKSDHEDPAVRIARLEEQLAAKTQPVAAPAVVKPQPVKPAV